MVSTPAKLGGFALKLRPPKAAWHAGGLAQWRYLNMDGRKELEFLRTTLGPAGAPALMWFAYHDPGVIEVKSEGLHVSEGFFWKICECLESHGLIRTTYRPGQGFECEVIGREDLLPIVKLASRALSEELRQEDIREAQLLRKAAVGVA